jgi:hypothetical protein
VHHSRSFTDLKLSRSPASVKVKGADEKGRDKDTIRNRRRSTLPWTGATPGIRQIKLEDIAESRMADTWFALHCSGNESPVYVSEIVEKAVNPSFKFFDLNSCGPLISRLDHLTFKFWARPGNMTEYILLLELDLSLRSLQFIGKTWRASIFRYLRTASFSTSRMGYIPI